MNRQTCVPVEQEQRLINLKDLKARTGMSTRQIAERENLSEKSVARVFSGEAKNPGVDLVRRIIHALGGTWSEIFGESGAVIGGQDLVTLQTQVDRLTAENGILTDRLNIANLDNSVLAGRVTSLESEVKVLNIKLEYEKKLNALHDYYNNLKPNS